MTTTYYVDADKVTPTKFSIGVGVVCYTPAEAQAARESLERNKKYCNVRIKTVTC